MMEVMDPDAPFMAIPSCVLDWLQIPLVILPCRTGGLLHEHPEIFTRARRRAIHLPVDAAIECKWYRKSLDGATDFSETLRALHDG
jgi:hypothetical protein